jgi:rhodanese-related sulfurtransferase
MKMTRQEYIRSAVIGLFALLATTGAAQAGDAAVKPDGEFLARWQKTFDGLRDMTPKWGNQGVDAFKASLDAGVPVVLLNVCTPEEWREGVIQGSLLISLNELPKPESLARLPRDRNTIIGIYCKAGHRSTLALSLLHQLGYRNAVSMSGGITAWRKAGYPVVAVPK